MIKPILSFLLLGATAVSVLAQSTPTPTPILFFDFNNTGGGTASEISSTGSSAVKALFRANGKGATSEIWSADGAGVSGKPGDFAFDLSKSTGMGKNGTGPVAIVKDAPIGSLKSLTICGWYKTATPIDEGARIMEFVDSNNNGFLFVAGKRFLNFWVSNKGASSTTLEYGQTDTWVFFAVSYNTVEASNNLTFYIGTAADGLTSQSFTAPQNPINNPNGTLFIGNSGGYARPLQGLIDNVALYGSAADGSGALKSSDIEAIFNSAKPVK